MGKITITKPTGSVDNLNLISAFKGENNIYVIFDSEKTGSMGLPIIYVSKYTDKLEKIDDANEWQSCKNYLKGIINGTSFEYVTIPEQVSANEAYYMQLSLPNQASFEAIKNRYTPTPAKEVVSAPVENLGTPEVLDASNTVPTPAPSVATEVAPVATTPEPAPSPAPTFVNTSEVPAEAKAQPEAKAPMEVPVINEVPSNVAPAEPIIPNVEPQNEAPKTSSLDFTSDKATFLKACENMFDALISKYQKELSNLEARSQALEAKEKDIEQKLASADEHLKNAEAKEQVANIAHDNASKIMDISTLMPNNPNN